MTLPNILIATDFACGGIVTTILNNKQIIWNPRLEGSVDGTEHQSLKDVKSFNQNINKCNPDVWYHTHTNEGLGPASLKGRWALDANIPLHYFNKKLIITTENIYSRYIIFLRCNKFKNPNWIEDTTPESIDKIRELAKEYAIPRITKTLPGCESVELIDLIHNNHKLFDTNNTQWEAWKEKNRYLYEKNHWLSKRFSEAQWEIETQQLFKYT